MKYSVSPQAFKLNPNLAFGIVIGLDINNGPSTNEDIDRLRRAEQRMRKLIPAEQLKQWPSIAAYREVMKKAGINPNKFPFFR